MNAPVSAPVARQAIHWWVELQGGAGEPQRQAWLHWRAANPEHERAWQRIEQVNSGLGALQPGATRAALNSLAQAGRRRALKALGLALLVAPAGWLAQRQARPLLADYHTGVGERQQVSLPDGSRLDLNTSTAVNLAFNGPLRRLALLNGEIALQVVANAQPLTVEAGSGSVAALQGTFGLRRFAQHCQLTVSDGQVLVRCSTSGQQMTVNAGEQVRFDAHRISVAQPAPAQALAWRNGLFIARDLPLQVVLEELARYRSGWLICDPAVAGLRVSGSFPLQASDAALDLLAQVLPVKVQRRTAYWVKVG